MFRKKLSVFLFLSISSFAVYCQPTISLQNCEEAFVKNNLMLLAESFNIESARAAVIQAKIWELPYLSGELNLINPESNTMLDLGRQGQKALAVEQLIYLGGKKKAEVAFAKSNVAIAELSYQQLLLNLRYQLYQNFYGLYFDGQKVQHIKSKISNIDSLVASYALQVERGNVSLRDLVRLQALSVNLKKQLTEIQTGIVQQQENLKVLTGLPLDFSPIVEEANLNKLFDKRLVLSVEALQQIALEKNAEYLLFNKLIESDEMFLKWQKSLSQPDLTLGASYDQRGGGRFRIK